jgi:Prolyl oligopeptidase family
LKTASKLLPTIETPVQIITGDHESGGLPVPTNMPPGVRPCEVSGVNFVVLIVRKPIVQVVAVHLKRLAARTRDRDLPVSTRTAEAQLRAIREWGAVPSSNRYATLQNIKHPTLIMHGTRDIVVLPINAFILAERLPDAQLIMYPDSSHGAQYQQPEVFLKHAKLFLGACYANPDGDRP